MSHGVPDELPTGLRAYKRTPIFDADTIPAGLRRMHRTKPGVWALIHVLEGRLRYRILDADTELTLSEQILSSEMPGVVQPEQPHEVAPLEPLRFFVEFFAAEPVDGPHTVDVL